MIIFFVRYENFILRLTKNLARIEVTIVPRRHVVIKSVVDPIALARTGLNNDEDQNEQRYFEETFTQEINTVDFNNFRPVKLFDFDPNAMKMCC